jgi:hypothetical protein
MSLTRITDAVVIPKHYIAFNNLAFVTGAISKDETRYVLNHIEVKRHGLRTTYAATDGRRLHVAELDPGLFDDDIDVLDPGLYLLISKSSKFIVLQKNTDEKMSYPDWKLILGSYEIGDNLAEVCEVADSGKIGEVMIRTERLVDTSFLAAAMGYGTSRKTTESVSLNFEAREDNGPVIIAHDHGTALVMPLRRKEPEDGLPDNQPPAYETAPIKAFADALAPGDSVEFSVDGIKVGGLSKDADGALTVDSVAKGGEA